MKRDLSLSSMAAFVAGSQLGVYATSAANFSTEAVAKQASSNKTEARLAHSIPAVFSVMNNLRADPFRGDRSS